MPFFVYGRDAKSGDVARRRVSHAATAAEARAEVERQGIEVTSVLPCPELRIAPSPSAPEEKAAARATIHREAVAKHPIGKVNSGRALDISGRLLLAIAALLVVLVAFRRGQDLRIAAAVVGGVGALALYHAYRMRSRSVAGAPPSARFATATRVLAILAVVAAFSCLCYLAIPRLAWNAVNMQAMAYARKGENARAVQIEKLALRLAEHAEGAVSVPAAVCANNLGKIYLDSTQYDLAEPEFLRALSIRERLLPADHADIAQSLHNLAALYVNQQRFDQARPLLESALAIQEKSLGADSVEVAMTLNGLGLVEMSSGRFASAEEDQRRALSIREAHGTQPEVAESLANLAAVYLTQNRSADAAPLFARALSIWEKTLDANHPNLALCLDGLGTAYVGEGRYDEAESLLQRALSIREHAYGERHPAIAETVESLGLLYRKQGKYAAAAPYYERMLAIEEKMQKPDSPSLAALLDGVALFYREAGKPEQASALAARALAIRERVH